jgi:cell division protein FtsW
VVTGSMPTKGMSLPFISYGGSNLMVTFIMVGLILNVLRAWGRPVLSHSREL